MYFSSGADKCLHDNILAALNAGAGHPFHPFLKLRRTFDRLCAGLSDLSRVLACFIPLAYPPPPHDNSVTPRYVREFGFWKRCCRLLNCSIRALASPTRFMARKPDRGSLKGFWNTLLLSSPLAGLIEADKVQHCLGREYCCC